MKKFRVILKVHGHQFFCIDIGATNRDVAIYNAALYYSGTTGDSRQLIGISGIEFDVSEL